MEQEIIYTEHYALIVSDEKIVEGSFIYETNIGEVSKVDKWYCEILEKGVKVEPSVKVIAHRPLSDAPILEGVPLLPKFSKKDDVEKEAKDYADNSATCNYEEGINVGKYQGFIEGYNKAKETYKYTEDDLRKALLIKHDGLSVDYVIQSLQTKRPKYFECETITMNKEYTDKSDYPYQECEILKTITNIQGQTELIGTYYYE